MTPRYFFQLPCSHWYYDTAKRIPELSDPAVTLTPIEVAKRMDTIIGRPACDYEEIPSSVYDESMEQELDGWLVYIHVPEHDAVLESATHVIRRLGSKFLCALRCVPRAQASANSDGDDP